MTVQYVWFQRGMRTGWRSVASALLLSSLLVACVHESPPPPPEFVAGERKPYVIGVTDILQLAVWKNPELSVAVAVRPDGKISVPLLDDVQAEGLTPQELKEVLTEALSEFIAAPDVTVLVREMNSQLVYLLGEGVRSNGAIQLRKEMRVLEAIATMGGFTIWADKNRVRILRKTRTGLTEYRFNYGAYLAGKAPDSNIVLQAGDTIVVEN
ncbi:MAG: polysaccharide biosynthesis/export family protein [Myxococcales bacterium]|nr:polysaccharide biosynthesis/export family protein [Myxococcales bacterium]